jgi:hypothetical protein
LLCHIELKEAEVKKRAEILTAGPVQLEQLELAD